MNPQVFKVPCSWCKVTLIEVHAPDSHGICVQCANRELASVRALPTSMRDEITCRHGVPGTAYCLGCEAEVPPAE